MELRQELASAFKEATGMSPEEFAEQREETKRLRQLVEKLERAQAVDLMNANVPPAYARKMADVARTDPHKGLGLRYARFARICALANRTNSRPEEIALKWGDKWMADEISASREKALSAGTGTSGGYLVPEDFQPEVIELLRSMSVVRKMGARVVPMRNGNLSVPKQTGAGTAAYVGENTNITSSQQTFGQVNLVTRKLAALTPISNDLLRESDVAVDALVRDDLSQIMALREDLAFIRGTGVSDIPKGIRFQVNAAQTNAITQASAPSTVAEIRGDLFKAIRLVKAANIKLINPGWIMTTRTSMNLMSLQNSGIWQFPEMAQGKLLGFPFEDENQIPENLGGSTDETEVYFVEFSNCLIGDAMAMEIEVFPGGTYHDGSSVVSGISQDQTVIRAIAKHDFGLRHDKTAAVITGVDWY